MPLWSAYVYDAKVLSPASISVVLLKNYKCIFYSDRIHLRQKTVTAEAVTAEDYSDKHFVEIDALCLRILGYAFMLRKEGQATENERQPTYSFIKKYRLNFKD